MRLTGFSAIEYAEKQGLRLTQLPDAINEGREGLSIAEAEAVASEDESLIYLEVPDGEYAAAPPTSYEPDR
ncbi:MAG: hypothetical protein U0736_22195 [Gemmataceae bacterium]